MKLNKLDIHTYAKHHGYVNYLCDDSSKLLEETYKHEEKQGR